MTNTAFDWQIDEFMIYCRSRQLREKTMLSYEQTLCLFEHWCKEQLNIVEVDKVTESVVRCYINDLQERGKYSFYSNDNQKQIRVFHTFLNGNGKPLGGDLFCEAN